MQCRLEFTAVRAIVAAASLVGVRIVIRPKRRDDWTVVPNLWGAVVVRPGTMKTPALGEFLNPLRRIEAKARQAYE